MPSIETMLMHQTAVMWEAVGNDGYGEPTVKDGVEIPCRWEAKQVTVDGPDGEPLSLDGWVAVRQEVKVGSLMFLGTLVQWSALTGTTSDKLLHEVKMVGNIPDIKNRNNRKTLGVQRFRQALPTIVA